MAVPVDIGTISIDSTKSPCTLISDLLSTAIQPGVQERIGGSLHLFVRGHVDSFVSCLVIIRTLSAVTAKAGGVRHGCVNSVTSKEVVIGTESVGSALGLRTVDTEILTGFSEDEEDVVQA